MKLYLSSYRVPTPDKLIALIGKSPAETHLVVIPNAKDYYADRARQFKIDEAVAYFHELGFQPTVLDLRSVNQAGVTAALQAADAVWLCGGNTFCLRAEMRRSGFDQVITEAVEQGLVYAGESAGAIVAGPTLKGTELADEPQFAAEHVEQGLGLIRQIIIPHADNPVLKDGVAPMLKLHADNPDAVILNDDQALIIDGDIINTVTPKS